MSNAPNLRSGRDDVPSSVLIPRKKLAVPAHLAWNFSNQLQRENSSTLYFLLDSMECFEISADSRMRRPRPEEKPNLQ